MGALKLTACMKVVSKMGDMDQEALLERLDRYTGDGVPKDRAQVMAASDALAELQDERREFMAMLREQHPDLFRVTNAIPEDQDVDPDAPDIQRSPGRSEEEIAAARAEGWTIADNDLPSREAAERIVKLRTKGNSVVKPMAAWQEAEVRVVESDNPGLWSIEVRNPGIQRSPARDITDTTEFKRWFGDSKVVDADGKPLVVYHGTSGDFATFRDDIEGRAGFYFTDDIEFAQQFAEGDGANMMPVYLAISKPADLRSGVPSQIEDALEAAGYSRLAELLDRDPRDIWNHFDGDRELSDMLQRAGYDGLRLAEPEFKRNVDSWVAFRPEQIKSAIGNNGQFDPENADITRSAARTPMGFYSALAKGVEDMQTKQAPSGAWKTQIKGLVNKGQVKQDEIEWSGIEDFLDLQEGKVTKDQILEYLNSKSGKLEVLSRYADGESSGSIAKSIGIGETTVLRWVKSAGISRTASETKGATKEKIAEAVRLYGQGLSIAEVAKAVELGTSTIHRALVAAGVNRSLAAVRDADAEVREEALRLYASGMNTYEAAASVGVSQTAVASWAAAAGISRGYSGAQALRVALGRHKTGRGIKAAFKSNKGGGELYAASLYELGRMHQLEADDGVASFGRSTDRIPYGDGRAYVPDLEVVSSDGNVFVEEIKPHVQLGDTDVLEKARAAEDFYKDKGKTYRLISEYAIGHDGFDRIDPDSFAQEDRDRVRSGLATIRWALGQVADAEGEGEITLSRKRDVTDTPEFKAWSGGAPLVELGDDHDFRSGQPVVVEALHGTTNASLTQFERERANIESDWGAGFYSSNTPDDVAANYANSEGPDLTNRIERLAETLADNEFDDDIDAARQEARRRMTDGAPNTLKLYVSFQNPAVLGGDGETFLDWNESFDEETEEYGKATGKLVDFIEAVREAAEDFDAEDGLGDFIDGLISSAEGEGVKLSDVVWQTKNTPIYAYNNTGDNAASELIRRGLEGAGFDGVIDTTVRKKFNMKGMNDGTVHFIAFQPEQLKSATGNRGTFDPNDADITRSPGRTATGAAWDSPSAGKFDDLVYKLQDKNIDTKRVVEAIQAAGGAIADDLNVYLQEELYHGRAAKRTEDFVNMELNPLVGQLARDGLQLEDLEEFLHARHAKEANEVIAQRNPGVQDLQDGGSGMKTGDAQQYLASLPTDLRQKLESAAAKVDAILKKTRELYVDYELESRDTVDAWGKMFQHYIPLMREDKDGNGSPGLGQGFSVKGRETKGRTGSTRKVVDIMANIAMQRERAIVRGEKNRVSQALVGLATANPNEGFWQVDEVPTERVFNEKTGLVEDRVDPLYKSRPNAVIAKIKGANGQVKEHAVLFNEEDERAMRMAAALKNLDAAQLEGLMGVSAMISRYFAASVTQWNPLFGPVNMIRDVQAVALNLSSTPIKGEERKVMRNVMPALAGVYKDLRAARKGKTTNTQWAKLWEEFQDVGGQTGYRDLFRNSEERANAIKKVLDPDAWADTKLGKIFTAGGVLKVPLAQARRAAAWIFDWLSDYNDALENGVRLAVYKAGLDRGLSKEQAASIAKNASTNFNRKGQIGQQAGALYAFFNAAVQGTARIGDTLFDMEPGKPKTLRLSSVGKKIVGGGVLLGAIQALMLAAAGYDDEDPPQFARERSLIIPIGDKKYISIPMPLGFNVIPNIGRIATEFALGGFKDPHERAVQLISLFSETFNPIGSAGLSMQTLAPTALDPLVALTENKDWTGKPIARESSNPAIPGHALAKDTATTWSKAISEAINTLSGGNKYVAGVFSPSPDQIDYLLTWATGGVGREISKLEQTVSAAVTGEELPPYKIPLVGRFYGNARSQASEGTAFYANTEDLNKLETEIKGLEKDGKRSEAAELRRSRSDAYLITVANQAERQIQRLRQQKRDLIKADAPREQVAAIDQQITGVMARLNRAVESLREKRGE